MTKTIWTAALICLATGAQAEGQWTLGILGGGSTGYYVGEKDQLGAVPFIAYDTEKFHIGLDGLSYQVLDFGIGQIDASLGYRAAPEFPGDDPLFDGLKRDSAIELGLSTRLDFGNAYLGLSADKDVSDVHDGVEANASVGYAVGLGSVGIDATVGAKFRDANLNQYLYGVSKAEQRPGRAAFAAGDTVTGFASITASYSLTRTVSVFGQADYESLGDNADSPLVDEDGVFGVKLGVLMQF